MSENDPFAEYRETEVEITSEARDGFTLDVNGTRLFIRQVEHVPVLMRIFVGDEQRPIGTFNVAKSETVTLGGHQEGISDELSDVAESLSELQEKIRDLELRTNPPKERNSPNNSTEGDDD